MDATRWLDLMGRYEVDNDLSNDELIELFSDLVKTGVAWELQGSYGRVARALIREGFISVDGDILWKETENA